MSATSGLAAAQVPRSGDAPPAVRELRPVPLPALGAVSWASAPSATWTVRRGDNLWRIAAIGAGHEDIADYWRRLITANAGLLRSGDPDLIYPGEQIVLPGN